jgi:hypothetical protein
MGIVSCERRFNFLFINLPNGVERKCETNTRHFAFIIHLNFCHLNLYLFKSKKRSYTTLLRAFGEVPVVVDVKDINEIALCCVHFLFILTLTSKAYSTRYDTETEDARCNHDEQEHVYFCFFFQDSVFSFF